MPAVGEALSASDLVLCSAKQFMHDDLWDATAPHLMANRRARFQL